MAKVTSDTTWIRCDWHPDRPTGLRCGMPPATHRIVWLDGTNRASYGCGDHLELDPEATPHRIERLNARHGGAR